MVKNVYSNLKEIKRNAIDTNIPIMQDETMEFITNYIGKKKTYRILEIGAAVGYSSIMMALVNPKVSVVTIEKDQERYKRALKNIKKMGLDDRITLIYNDALDVKLEEKFDLIIIDAAKSKNLDFFAHFEDNLASGGTVITDNINFHGFVLKDLDEISSRNVRGLVRKIRKYKDFLQQNLKYKTSFYDLGDGISVTERRL